MGNIVEGVIEYMETKGVTRIVEFERGWRVVVCNYCDSQMQRDQGCWVCPGCKQVQTSKDVKKTKGVIYDK